MDGDLLDHVRAALAAGQSEAEIRASLSAAGWTRPEIDAAFSRWMVRDAGGPVPRPVRSAAARTAFFQTLLFVVFGMVAGNALGLLLGLIDYWMPDPGITFHGSAGALRWSMAALIVFAPVFWLLDRADIRAVAADPSLQHGMVRRWLSAIAMLLAVVTLLGDALFLIYSWLDGQITLRFLVKSATVAVMALIVLGYFRDDRGVLFPAARGLVCVTILTLILSFWTIGGPAKGQMEQRDTWRLGDLRTLASDVADCLSVDRRDAPETLDPMSCARNPARLTGYASDVTYEPINPRAFRLCIDVENPEALSGRTLEVDGARVCLRQTFQRPAP